MNEYREEIYKIIKELIKKTAESSSGSIKPDYNIFVGATQEEIEPFRNACMELCHKHDIAMSASDRFDEGLTINWYPLPGYPRDEA